MQSLNQSAIKHKLGLLNLTAELGNVSRACKVMGLSRDTFYRYQAAVQEGERLCRDLKLYTQAIIAIDSRAAPGHRRADHGAGPPVARNCS